MTTTVSITEFARNLSEYVNRVVYRGERYVLLRGKHPVAEVGPVAEGQRLGDLVAVIASAPQLTPDEAAAFSADLDAARAEFGALPADQWLS